MRIEIRNLTPCLILILTLFHSVSQQAQAATATGPLRANSTNGRYFTDGSGQAIYLTGSHTWDSFQDWGGSYPAFDYNGYLNLLTQKNHNFIRLWTFWLGAGGQKPGVSVSPDPGPWLRTGPGTGVDGRPKYNFNAPNQAYFDRLRSRTIAARDRGIYVGIMFFLPGGYTDWNFSPFNPANNVNGIDGPDFLSLGNTALLEVLRAHIRRVIDQVNDLDNVLYEIINEAPTTSTDWQYNMINYVKSYQNGKPKRHPVGMTSDGGNPPDDTSALLNSPADWVSLGGSQYVTNPPSAPVNKVSLLDSDHMQGGPADPTWIWKGLALGHNPIHMEATYRGIPAWEGQLWNSPSNPSIGPSQNAQGYARSYATRMNLLAATPQGGLSSTGYCLANVGSEYLVYQPGSGGFSVNLAAGTYSFEWFNASSGSVAGTGSVSVAAGSRSFTPPFSGHGALYLKNTGGGGGGGGGGTPGTQTPFSGTPKAIPGTIATAQYDNGGEGVAYHDVDGANLASSTYRPGLGVDSSGSGVGWISASEWLEYTVNVGASGSYNIAIPVSHPGTGGSMHVKFNGVNVTGALGLPNTGSWSTYQNINATVNLSAGTQVMLVSFDTNGSTGYGPGLNDIVITSAGGGGTPGTQSPFNGAPAAIPGTVTIGNYDNGGEGVAYHDTDASNNASSTFRPGLGVDADGTRIGWVFPGEWIEYTVNVTAAATYNLSMQISNPGNGGAFHINFDGVNKTGAITVPNTGSWGTFQTITASASLSAGQQVMQIFFDSNSSAGAVVDLRNITFSAGGGGGGGTPGTQTPFSGSAITVPGTIATAQYDNGGEGTAFHDTDGTNQMSSTYRPGLGVDSNGSGIGWILGGEWLEYTVNVGAAGSYTIAIPVSQEAAGGTMHVSFDGLNKTGSLSIPNTGNWNTYQNVSATVSLSAGTQIMQVAFEANGSNGYGPGLGNIAITAAGGGGGGGGGTGSAIPGTIAASNYDNGGEGVAYHDWDAANLMSSTFRPGLGVDANAGQGLGWVQAGEWINYTVNVSGAGNYVITLSVCHPGAGGTFHINFNGVNKTGTLTVPNTGSWSTNQNMAVTVNLSAGSQVMQIVFDTNGSSGYVCGLADAMVFTPTGSG